MKLIVIANPSFFKEEVTAVRLLFENNLMYFHLRKPDAGIVEFQQFLNKIDAKYHKHIILHDYFELCNHYAVKGIHHNAKNQSYTIDFNGFKTRACHTFDEIIAHKNNYDYLLLSPIFHSISKKAYRSAFTENELTVAAKQKIIDDKVIAMGGIEVVNIAKVKTWNFGGIAVLGYLWNEFLMSKNYQLLLSRFNALQNEVKNVMS